MPAKSQRCVSNYNLLHVELINIGLCPWQKDHLGQPGGKEYFILDSVSYTYEGHPINSENFLIIEEFVPL